LAINTEVSQALVVIPQGRTEFDLNFNLGKHGNSGYWDDYMEKGNVSEGLAAAYASSEGYAITVNPDTGYTEMYVAGTKTARDWAQNFVEGYNHSIGKLTNESGFGLYSEGERNKRSNELSLIAERHIPPVDVVLGHSRGDAIVGHMDGKKFKLIGLDGATSIGDHHPDKLNLSSGSAFDRLIGFGHDNTVIVHGTPFHNVTKKKRTRKRSEISPKDFVGSSPRKVVKKKVKKKNKSTHFYEDDDMSL